MLRRLLPLAFLLPLVFAGCDTADDSGDTFPLPSDVNHRASFVYMAGTLEAGDTFTDSKSQSSQAVINDSRFEPSDIASARIQEGSVELNLDFPGGDENEIVIDEAVLTLSAEGVGEQVVARGSDFSLAILTTNAQLRREVLELADADITDFLRQESFTGTLRLEVAGAGSQSYQFTVTFDVDASVTVDAANRVLADF